MKLSKEELKRIKIERKWRESVPLERAERRKNGRPTSSILTADRMLYDQPINKQATKELFQSSQMVRTASC